MLTALAPFRSGSFRLLWSSRLVSACGFWMDSVVTGWLALEVGGSAAAVGTVLALRLLPYLLLGIVAGTAADRFPRRSVLLATGSLAATVALTLGVLVGGSIQLWQIALLAFVGGCVMVFDFPARTALAVDLVGRAALPRAVALNSLALYFFGAVGAFAGGLVIPAYGPSTAYFLVAGGHLTSVLLITAIRGLPRRQAAGTAPLGGLGFGPAMAGAARLIVENPGVRMVVVSSLVVELFGYSYQTAIPSVARDVLQAGPRGLGVLQAGASIGATAAVALLTFLPGSVRRQPLMVAVILTWGLAQIALGASASFPLSLLAMLAAGGCSAAVDALQQTLVQLAVPEEQRGRAMGVWVFSIGTNAIGFYQVGLVAAAIGTPLGLIANGSAAIVCGLLIVAVTPTYRWSHRPAAPPAARQPAQST